MVTENQAQHDSPAAATREAGTAPRSSGRALAFKLTTLLLAATSVLAVAGAMKSIFLPPEGDVVAVGGKPTLPPLPKQLFANWPKQDLMILLSADQRGYLLPCGCSEPQKGGLERRYNLVQMMKSRGWPVIALDLGNIPQTAGPLSLPNVQGPIKYKHSMEALHKIGYSATGIGRFEMAMPLDTAMGVWTLQQKEGETPRLLAANLKDPIPGFQWATQWATAPGTDLKVGVVGVVGPSVVKEIKDPNIKFDDYAKVLPDALKALGGQAHHFRVLLFQGTPEEARTCIQAFPQFQIVLCLDHADEPSEKSETIGQSLLISVGHKGRFVGVVGVNWTPEKKLQFRYQIVELGPEFKTPQGLEKDNPVLQLMEEYTKELKSQHFLDKYGKTKHPIQVTPKYAASVYVGSEKCKKCHEHAYKVWEKTPHAHAYEALVSAKSPGNRQHDGECIVCHVTGFQHVGGFQSEKGVIKKEELKHVGCESCHGPASMHLAAVGGAGGPTDEALHALLNPWKALSDKKDPNDGKKLSQRHLAINDFCMKCHDQDNDVHWDFKTKWPKIEHPTP